MTEDYSQVVDHISVSDRFNYLPVIARSCHFGLKPIFHDKINILNMEKDPHLSLVKAKDKKISLRHFTSEDVSHSTVYFS